MIVRVLPALLTLGLVFAPWAAPAGSASYAGTITFVGAETSGMAVKIAGTTATVTLGPGHVAGAQVAVRHTGTVLRFSVPGLPRPVAFVLRQKAARLVGTATQGSAHGEVTLTRGARSPDASLGYYASPRVEVVRFTRYGFSSSPLAVDLDTGTFHPPPTTPTERLGVRQYEVRIPAPGAVLAGTLTLPPGPGPFPAAVYVSGSGPTLREESHWLDSVFVSRGVAVLAYDKRGVGQSSGRYPGSLASAATIGLLAGDALAAARFVAGQPGIDRARVGFYGISQAGWIIPQAAVRAGGAVSWAVIESGPLVTQGESDSFYDVVQSAGSIAEAEAQAQALGPSGYDPAPWVRQLAIPVLWLYGGDDRNQPTGRSMQLLRGLAAGHDFETALYPGAPHSLFDRAGFPDGLFARVAGWLTAHSLR
jgi:dipeptidyl aminopeptidase/acylaminoacyl peptidase